MRWYNLFPLASWVIEQGYNWLSGYCFAKTCYNRACSRPGWVVSPGTQWCSKAWVPNFFLQKRAPFVLTTVKCATSLSFVRKSTCHCQFFESGKSKLWIREERLSSHHRSEKGWEKYENGKDVGNQVNILSWVQVAGKYGFEILDPCANKLNCHWGHSFL